MAIKAFELATELGIDLNILRSKAKQLKIKDLLMSTALSKEEEKLLRQSLSKFRAGGTLKKKNPIKKATTKKTAPATAEDETPKKPKLKKTSIKKTAAKTKSAEEKLTTTKSKAKATLDEPLEPKKEVKTKAAKSAKKKPVKKDAAGDAPTTEQTTAAETTKKSAKPSLADSSPAKASKTTKSEAAKSETTKSNLLRVEFGQTGTTSTPSNVSDMARLETAEKRLKILKSSKVLAPKPAAPIKFIRKIARKPAQPTEDGMPAYKEVDTPLAEKAKKSKRGVQKGHASKYRNNFYNKFQSGRYVKTTGTKSSKKSLTPTPIPKRRRDIQIPQVLTVSELSNLTGLKAGDLIKSLMDLEIMANINQVIDSETAQLICHELGVDVKVSTFDTESLLSEDISEKDKLKRPPVVTIMGHVDHGKTSLLDKIRRANVVAGEAGGITQHIGAYFVPTKEGGITFLDTPGHEAFTSMRARGANATDIVILVVAADDGPKPQTVEAINHAKAAEVPILVAINKCDRPEADPEKTKQRLMEVGLIAESYGGNVTMVNVSAKTGTGIDELLDLIALQAETMELTASTDMRARGVVIESRLDKVRGNVVSLLVQAGSLRLNDFLIAGITTGKVKAMFDHRGKKLDRVLPSYPVEILGMNQLPQSGDQFLAAASEKISKTVQQSRIEKKRAADLKNTPKVRMEDLFNQLKETDMVNLNLILKTDVQGSLEAIKNSLNKWNSEKINIRYLHSSVGAITSSDIALASASDAIVIGFNVRPDQNAKALSEQENVQIKIYNVIYNIFDDIKSALEGMIAPIIHEEELGKALVLNVFNIPKVGVIAGCRVESGKVLATSKVRVLRDNIVIHNGKISSLKRFQDSVKEVFSGFECGLMLDNFKDIKSNDALEFYWEKKETPTLKS